MEEVNHQRLSPTSVSFMMRQRDHNHITRLSGNTERIPVNDILEIIEDDEKFEMLKKEIRQRGRGSSHTSITRHVICDILGEWKQEREGILGAEIQKSDSHEEGTNHHGLMSLLQRRISSVSHRRDLSSGNVLIENKIEKLRNDNRNDSRITHRDTPRRHSLPKNILRTRKNSLSMKFPRDFKKSITNSEPETFVQEEQNLQIRSDDEDSSVASSVSSKSVSRSRSKSLCLSTSTDTSDSTSTKNKISLLAGSIPIRPKLQQFSSRKSKRFSLGEAQFPLMPTLMRSKSSPCDGDLICPFPKKSSQSDSSVPWKLRSRMSWT